MNDPVRRSINCAGRAEIDTWSLRHKQEESDQGHTSFCDKSKYNMTLMFVGHDIGLQPMSNPPSIVLLSHGDFTNSYNHRDFIATRLEILGIRKQQWKVSALYLYVGLYSRL